MQVAFIFKNEKEEKYRSIVFLFVILHGIFFTYLLIETTSWITAALGLIMIALDSIFRLVISKIAKQKFSYGSNIFLLFLIIISGLQIWWLLIAEGLLFILSRVLLQKKAIYFNPFMIELKALPNKRYKWNDLTNVILKDNMLTLDFKNNKLLQAEIEPANINEDAFNTFAKQQLVNI